MTVDISAGLYTGMLAFSRSFQISEALLWAVGPDDKRLPIIVQEKGVRGQTSNAPSSTSDKETNEGGSNIQTVDNAMIPGGCDTFVISFTARVMPDSQGPGASDDPVVADNFQKLAASYAKNGGYKHLAARYIGNILNGRFAWRNRWQSDYAQVVVRFGDSVIKADPFALPLDAIADRDMLVAALTSGSAADLDAFINLVETGLTSKAATFDVEWVAKMPGGSEVFPSQEYLRGEVAEKMKAKGADGGKSRVYAVIPSYIDGRRVLQASIHSQKINAAIRHIDDWHGDVNYGPIAVNAYSGVQETGAVLRSSSRGTSKHLYAVMKDVDLLAADVERPADDMSGDTHFFFANLIRGGVYGVSLKDKTPKTAKSKKAKEEAVVDA